MGADGRRGSGWPRGAIYATMGQARALSSGETSGWVSRGIVQHGVSTAQAPTREAESRSFTSRKCSTRISSSSGRLESAAGGSSISGLGWSGGGISSSWFAFLLPHTGSGSSADGCTTGVAATTADVGSCGAAADDFKFQAPAAWDGGHSRKFGHETASRHHIQSRRPRNRLTLVWSAQVLSAFPMAWETSISNRFRDPFVGRWDSLAPSCLHFFNSLVRGQ